MPYLSLLYYALMRTVSLFLEGIGKVQNCHQSTSHDLLVSLFLSAEAITPPEKHVLVFW